MHVSLTNLQGASFFILMGGISHGVNGIVRPQDYPGRSFIAASLDWLVVEWGEGKVFKVDKITKTLCMLIFRNLFISIER